MFNRKPSELPTQAYMRLAEHPVTHHVQHVAVFANSHGDALVSFPAVLNAGRLPSIRDVRSMMKA